MTEKTSIPPGRYRHFKGNEYTVIGTARHSETLEEHVVYRQEYGEHGLWVRPKQMFLETVTVHRLLEFDPATGDFKRNQQHALTGDLFVLDEASMVDVVLGWGKKRSTRSQTHDS